MEHEDTEGQAARDKARQEQIEGAAERTRHIIDSLRELRSDDDNDVEGHQLELNSNKLSRLIEQAEESLALLEELRVSE